MKTLGVIPARFASTRFEGKPLVVIKGKTMIQRVYEQAKKCKSLDRVVVATDDERIFNHVQSFGGDVVMTAATHQSGTDRCAEAVETINFDIQTALLTPSDAPIVGKITPRFEGIFTAVVNIQGDEPYIQPEQIEKIVAILRGPISSENATSKAKKSVKVVPASDSKISTNFDIATLAKKIDNQELIDNSNIVKVAFNDAGKAMYFSRHPIPFLRNVDRKDWAKSGKFFKHIGLYGYKTQVLRDLARLPQSNLEQCESLEQLRWLENGFSIGVAETDLETIGIDTPEDLAKI
jgi:3-deoxy-manno-octulosonate cytidylyltransferase (CMP-KDO synthetase)